MTVGELKKELAKFDDALRVCCVDDNEDMVMIDDDTDDPYLIVGSQCLKEP